MKYTTIKESLFGECLGSIYIGLIHEFSGITTDAEMLSDFAEQLWSAFYDDGVGEKEDLFVCFDEYSFWISNSAFDPMVQNPRWYRVYEDGDQYCDLIQPTKEKSEDDEIEILKKRIDMLQDALIEAVSPTPKKDIRVSRKDFIKMYDKCTGRMFDEFDEGLEDGPYQNRVYGNDVTVHWNGVYCDCSDGATAWNHIIEGVKGVDSEEGDEL